MMQELWKPNEQRNLAPLSVPGASSAGSIRVVSGSGFRYVVPFPYRLHEMLSNVDTEHDSTIVSWLPDGRHFKVHDPRRFVEFVISSAFKQKSLKSFQRQLHLYGFQRVHEGVDKGAYYHEKFLRDERDLCLTITRTKAPKRSRIVPSTRNNHLQKIPTFNSRKKTTDTINNNNNNTSPIAMPAITISPSIFDDVSPLHQQSSHIPENSYSMKGPLHKSTSPTNAIDTHALFTPDQQSSSSSNLASLVEQTKQQQQQQQQHESSIADTAIADTCQWLINAGVPISAFDPVAIGDISHSTFAVPQFVSSSLSPVLQQKPIITPPLAVNDCPPNETSPMKKNENENETEPLDLNFGNHDMTSFFSNLPSHNSFSTLLVPFNGDSLVTDLLPGESLPMVDDALWAL